MLLTTAHAMADDVVQYAGRPDLTMADPDLYGLSACYRLYPAATGWIMLAVPSEREWARLVRSEAFATLGDDGRFASQPLRQDNDELLAAELGKVFRELTAGSWEQILLPQGIPCVEVTETVSHEYMYSEEFGRASGFVTDVEHPTFGPPFPGSPHFSISPAPPPRPAEGACSASTPIRFWPSSATEPTKSRRGGTRK